MKTFWGVEMPEPAVTQWTRPGWVNTFTETPPPKDALVTLLYTADQLRTVAAAARLKALEEAAALLDASADRQEAEWKAHIASKKKTHATSLHAIPRGYAQDIRALKGTT
jgi:hypothetical protein